jgi:hypothetical protein
MKPPRIGLIVLLAALAYALGHFSWYAPTPLGRVPVLDEAENLALARQIFDGTLPREPFYRAMGYPLVLAGLLATGLPADQLPLGALLLGVALHGAAAVLIGAIARRWFDDARAGLAAGLLAALNPVFVHYATQRLDASLGTVFFLAGLLALDLDRPKPRPLALPYAALAWTLAALVRPQFLTVLPVLPWLALGRGRPSYSRRSALAALAGVVALFAAAGLWQRRVGGEFRLLPWQGSYNLWAANQPGAHGRYYAQTVLIGTAGETPENPARRESLVIYARETGHTVPPGPLTPAAIDAMNAHWRTRFLDTVRDRPFAWAAQLLRKTYAFLNDWAQYNNKTYAFHAARSPWLAWNPLGWGVLLVLGTAGLWRLRAAAPAVAGAYGCVVLAVAAGVVLFFVSARFRLPVAALLCIPAGAALARPAWFFHALAPVPRASLALTMVVVAALAFSRFDGVRDARPFLHDHLLIAHAAQTVGDDAEVWTHAVAALALDPTRADAAEYVVTAGFNRQLAAPLAAAEHARWLAASRRLLAAAPGSAGPAAQVLAAAATRDRERLRVLSLAPAGPAAPDALGALALLGAATPAELDRLLSAAPDAGGTLFLMARQVFAADAFTAWAAHRETPAWSKALANARDRLFPAPSASR